MKAAQPISNRLPVRQENMASQQRTKRFGPFSADAGVEVAPDYSSESFMALFPAVSDMFEVVREAALMNHGRLPGLGFLGFTL